MLSFLLLLGLPLSADASRTCLTGTDPEVAADPASIATVREAVDAACPCEDYDGSKGNARGDYVRCASGVIKAQAELGLLRSQCRGTVKSYYTGSSCGRSPNRAYQPCISTNVKNGKIKCAIKPTLKGDGTTPSSACSDRTNSIRQSCSGYTTCIDASDTDGNLVISAEGDDGDCVVQDDGTACSDGAVCASGHCVDGVCCENACGGLCEACSAAYTGGVDGDCLVAVAGTDPHGDCLDAGVATCGQTGQCDGAGACQLYSPGSTCDEQRCDGLTFIAADLCNESATCIDNGTSNCDDGNVCTDDSCSAISGCSSVNNSSPCDDGAACTVGDTCSGGSCVPGTQIDADFVISLTQQIDEPDDQDRVHLKIELVSVTSRPVQFNATSLNHPVGFTVESLVSTCSAVSSSFRCRHALQLLATTACSDTGDYQLELDYVCSPAAAGCNLCSGSETIDFALVGSDFCTEPEVEGPDE